MRKGGEAIRVTKKREKDGMKSQSKNYLGKSENRQREEKTYDDQ